MIATFARSTIALAVWLFCAFATAATHEPLDPRRDYHSYANTAQFRVKHVALDLEVDFATRRLHAEVLLRFDRLDETARTLILDSRDLDIREVTLVTKGKPRALTFRVGQRDPILGAPLVIALPKRLDGVEQQIRIRYSTSPDATALQWLEPSQTAGGKRPFLYSQSQPVHARSWIPLQDTPSVRVTYSARVRTPQDMLAVMSAANEPNTPRDGDYTFEMPQPVPSYLIALAVGDLEFRSVGPRSGVYAEPSVVAAAASEFSDVDAMLTTCERLFGPYRWGRYDLLILPPSFMWGGMENPRVSFITPTVIAGDKSLVALIGHELAHSWSGNLVTNATWRDIWLNEGFTTYLERRILGALYGEQRKAMEDVLGLQSLRRDLDDLHSRGDGALTHLAMDLRGRDPDDGFTDVAYEKGKLFIDFLESRVGRWRLDEFLRSYFDEHAFRSIDTETFREYLDRNLIRQAGSKLTLAEVDAWLYGPDLPPTAVLPKSDAFAQIDEQKRRWLAGEPPRAALRTAEWSTHQWLYFLDSLPTLTHAQMQSLDEVFGLTRVQNSEIAHSWLLNVVRSRYEPGYARLEQFLTSVGRRKLVRDLYQELAKTTEGKQRARAIYAKARPLYQVLLRAQLDELLDVQR